MWEYPAKVFWQENESKEQLLIFYCPSKLANRPHGGGGGEGA
jgi:hypothetical protein